MTGNNRPWEHVSDHSYFRRVLGNMYALGFGPKNEGQAHVRFGSTGIGHAPNYQIEGPDGAKHCFKGLSHEEAFDVDGEFAPNNLSEAQFSYADVELMLARTLRLSA